MASIAESSDTAGNSDELLTFEVEKTHQTLFQAGKALGKAFLTYFSLLSLTALLVYGRSIEDGVSVPLLGLKVNKDLAAAVTLLLCQLVQIWVISLLVQNTSLTNLFSSQLRERYKRVSDDSWYMQYPSPFHSFQFLLKNTPHKQRPLLTWTVLIGYIAIVAFVPYQLARAIANGPNFPVTLKDRWLVVNTILNSLVGFAIVTTALYFRRSSEERASAELKERRREILVERRSLLASQITDLENRVAEMAELRDKLLAMVQQATDEATKLMDQSQPQTEDSQKNSQS